MKPVKFEKNKVNFEDFKADTSTEKLLETLAVPDSALLPWFFSIDVLSVTKTVGKGRTNLTFIKPDIVQADATTPYASFNRQNSPQRNPIIQMHFEPSAYGITTVSNYIMVFSVETSGAAGFNLQGYAGAGSVGNAGPRTLNGKQTASLTFNNVPPTQQIYGYMEQTSGAAWSYYTTSMRFPIIIFQP
ncbi:hypothetical protein [Spirosoma koreense]